MPMFAKARRLMLAQNYVAALNARDLAAVRATLADDVTFTDSTGQSISGIENCMAATERFFAMDDSFRLDIDEYTPRGDSVLMRGHSVSRHAQLCTDELWRARFDGKKMVEWQSWARANPMPLARILSGATATLPA